MQISNNNQSVSVSKPLNARTQSITFATLFLYGLPQLAIAYIVLGIVNFTPAFYTTEMNISLLSISGLMLASRLLDVFTDPLIGIASDQTRSRWGRRKPWIVAGIPVLLLGVWLLFLPRQNADEVYFFIAISTLFLGLTFIQLPYIAWGSELSPDYDVRTKITGVREKLGAIGSILGLLTATILSLVFSDSSLRSLLATMTVVIFIILPLTFLIALTKVSKTAVPVATGAPTKFWTGVKLAFRNRIFRLFSLGIFLLYFGLMPGGALGWFLFDHILERPDLFAPTILGEFIASFIGLLFWTKFAVKTSKHTATTFALVWIALFTALVPVMISLGTWSTIITILVRSLALGALLMLPFSMIADVIDLDRAETGELRTGIYMAFGGIVIKMAITIGVAASLALPSLFGFEPSHYQNTQTAEFSVSATFSWLSGITFLMAAAIFRNFPLTREKLYQTQSKIKSL